MTHAELKKIMLRNLEAEGVTEEFRAGYIHAMETGGWLKPTAPAWIRKAAKSFLDWEFKRNQNQKTEP